MGQAQPVATEFVNIVFVPFYRKDQKGIQFENAPGEMKSLFVDIVSTREDIQDRQNLLATLQRKYDKLQQMLNNPQTEREIKEPQREIIFYNAGELPDESSKKDSKLIFRWSHPKHLEQLEKKIAQVKSELDQKGVELEEMEQAYTQIEKDHQYEKDQYFAEQAWIENVINEWEQDLKPFLGKPDLYSVKTIRRIISPQMIRYLNPHLVAIIYIIHTEEELDTLLQTPRKTLLIAEMNRNDPNGSCQKVDWLTKLSVRHPHLHLYRVHRDIGDFEETARKYCHYDSLIDILPDTRTSADLIEGAAKMLALLTLHAK